MTRMRSRSADQHTNEPLADAASSHLGVCDKTRKMTTIVTIIILAKSTHRTIRIAQTEAVDFVETAIVAE